MTDVRKVVLITGASGGVGAAAAEAFAEAGYDIGLTARTKTALETVAQAVRERGAKAIVIPTDISDHAAVQAAVDETVATFGRLDVLVLNAATTVFGAFTDVTQADFERVVAVSFLGAVDAVRCALPALTDSAGVIVSVGSLNSRVPLPAWSSYAAAKHGLRGFLNTLSIELAGQDSPVRIAQLHPGAIDTPVWTDTPTALGEPPRQPPEGRTAVQVGRALVALASNPRPEQVFGAEAIAMDQVWHRARPVGDALLQVLFRYFLSGHQSEQSNLRALGEAVGGQRGVRNIGGAIAAVTVSPLRLPGRLVAGLRM